MPTNGKIASHPNSVDELVVINAQGEVVPKHPDSYSLKKIGEKVFLWPKFDPESNPNHNSLKDLETLELGDGLYWILGQRSAHSGEQNLGELGKVRVSLHPGLLMGNIMPYDASLEVQIVFAERTEIRAPNMRLPHLVDEGYRPRPKTMELVEHLVSQ